MNDDFERTIERSLGERAGRLDISSGSIDDVLVRAERRQQRRRATAVVGSLAVVAVGFVGLSVARGADEPVGRADAPIGAPASTTAPHSIVDGHQDAFRCTDELDITVPEGGDGDHPVTYYAVCEHVLLIDGSPVEVVPTTIMMEVPVTWVECAPVSSSDIAVTTVPCGTMPHTAPATTVSYCEQPTDSPITVPCDLTPTSTAPCNTLPGEPDTCDTWEPAVATTTMVWAVSEVEQEHVVEPGDSLVRIADRYQIDVELIANYNAWPDGLDHVIFPDDVVMIPPGSVIPNG